VNAGGPVLCTRNRVVAMFRVSVLETRNHCAREEEGSEASEDTRAMPVLLHGDSDSEQDECPVRPISLTPGIIRLFHFRVWLVWGFGFRAV
jgi:hypothetical protein